MYGGWNFVSLIIYAILCGQSIGFWPFDLLATVVAANEGTEGTDDFYGSPNAKRIAIIGM
jgi:hypothetical protein